MRSWEGVQIAQRRGFADGGPDRARTPEAVGLNQDKFPNEDKMALHLDNLIRQMMARSIGRRHLALTTADRAHTSCQPRLSSRTRILRKPQVRGSERAKSTSRNGKSGADAKAARKTSGTSGGM